MATHGTKGYILYDLHNHSIFVSRNVVFYETVFPFKVVLSSSHRTPVQTFPILDDPPIEASFTQPYSTTGVTFSSDISASSQDNDVAISPQHVPSPSFTHDQSIHTDGTLHNGSPQGSLESISHPSSPTPIA